MSPHRGITQVATAYENIRERLRQMPDRSWTAPKEFIGEITEVNISRSDPLAHTIGGHVLTGMNTREIIIKAVGSMGEAELVADNGIPVGWDPRGKMISFDPGRAMGMGAQKIHLGNGVTAFVKTLTYNTTGMD